MNRIHTIILITVCFAFQLRAQVYDLNKFKYRYQQYYFLQTNYDLANKIDFLKSGIEPNRFFPNVAKVDLNLAGSITGQRFFNLDKKQLFENFNLVAGANNAYEQSFLR